MAILYLAFYASFGFYHVLSQSLAFVIMALVTALGGALALRYGAPAMAALALIGGYLTPLLVSTGEDHPIFYFGYILLLDLGAAALVRARKWLGLELLALCATALLYAIWFADRFSAGKETLATIFVLLFYVLFLIAEQPAVVIAAQALGAVVMAFIWPSNAVSYLALGTVMGAAGLETAVRRKIPRLAVGAVTGFWLIWEPFWATIVVGIRSFFAHRLPKAASAECGPVGSFSVKLDTGTSGIAAKVVVVIPFLMSVLPTRITRTPLPSSTRSRSGNAAPPCETR